MNATVRDPRARGFTLIELMVVIVILGMLVALVAPNIWHSEEVATLRTAQAQMHHIAAAIQQYLLEVKSLPPSLETLTHGSKTSGEPFIDKIPNDPWNHPYEYKPGDRKREYRLVSFGRDGIPGTEDDVAYPPKSPD